jgi:hypothetical protein
MFHTASIAYEKRESVFIIVSVVSDGWHSYNGQLTERDFSQFQLLKQ